MGKAEQAWETKRQREMMDRMTQRLGIKQNRPDKIDREGMVKQAQLAQEIYMEKWRRQLDSQSLSSGDTFTFTAPSGRWPPIVVEDSYTLLTGEELTLEVPGKIVRVKAYAPTKLEKPGHIRTEWLASGFEWAEQSDYMISLQLEKEGVVVIGQDGDAYETHTIAWADMENAIENPIKVAIEIVERHLSALDSLKAHVG